jgi:hypothetical protein
MRTLMTSLVDGIATTMASESGAVVRDMAVAKRINNYCTNMLMSFQSWS